MRHYLDGVKDFTKTPPRWVLSWGRADCIYRWTGCIVRPRPSYWKGGETMPYGVVVEVGQAIWLAVLWSDGRVTDDWNGSEVDCWHLRGVNELKDRMFARQVGDQELLAMLRDMDPARLIIDRVR